MKIVKHTFCNFEKCPLIGKEAEVTETVPALGKPDQPDYKPEWYWARVDGVQHKFQKGDLE